MSKIEQLTFPWSKPNNSSFDDFYFEKNNLSILEYLKSGDDLVIYGLSKVGKSFLLQSLCNYFSKSNKYDKIPVTKTKEIEVGNLGENFAKKKRNTSEIKNNNVVFNFNS